MKTDRLQYSVLAPKRPGNVALVEYDLEGQLIGIAFNADADEQFKLDFGAEIPITPEHLEPFKRVGCQIKDISNIDLSFEKFWNVYGNKMGHKKRCSTKWESLPREDKIMALGFIRRMRNYYDRKRIEMPYPETYLNQRRWENVIPK